MFTPPDDFVAVAKQLTFFCQITLQNLHPIAVVAGKTMHTLCTADVLQTDMFFKYEAFCLGQCRREASSKGLLNVQASIFPASHKDLEYFSLSFHTVLKSVTKVT